jgi:hypothetical protein
LVREQTFTSHLFQRDPAKSEADGEEEGEHRTHSAVLDEELESEMDHLHSDLEAQSPTMEDGPLFSRSGPSSRQPSSRYPTSRKTSTALSEQTHPGLDLAAELGRATGNGLVNEGGDIAEENKRLKEEVKALQLYCSKVGPPNFPGLMVDSRSDYRAGWVRACLER